MMKTKKINWKPSAAFFAVMVMAALVFAGCKDEPETDTRVPVITAYGASQTSVTVPPAGSVTLSCSINETDGPTAKSIVWSIEEKPTGSGVSISNGANGSASVSNMDIAGTYKFKLVVTGANDVPKTEYVTVNANLNATVEFVELGTFPTATLNFASKEFLPVGVTYTLTDDQGNTLSDLLGFYGIVTAADFYINLNKSLTFTQKFYFNDGNNKVELIGVNSERIVKVNVVTMASTRFGILESDTGSVTLTHP